VYSVAGGITPALSAGLGISITVLSIVLFHNFDNVIKLLGILWFWFCGCYISSVIYN
jgi:hypothetical protein